MEKLIINSAQMECTLGAAPAKLLITSQTYYKISGKLVATEKDKITMVNIPSFGVCKCASPSPPCVPTPTKWDKVSQLTSISGSKALLQSSFCQCAKGGKISFVDSGGNNKVGSK